jgi:predicted phosphatase
MTTITIHIENAKNAKLLEKMLRELSFVEEIEVKSGLYSGESNSNFDDLKKALRKVQHVELFKEIEKPSDWQRNLRHDW